MDQLRADGQPEQDRAGPVATFTEHPGVPSVLSENIPRLSTQTTAQVSAKYHCAFWNSLTSGEALVRVVRPGMPTRATPRGVWPFSSRGRQLQ